MTRYTLSARDNARIFHTDIWPAVAGDGAKVTDPPRSRTEGEPPTATWIIAPPAHLKSTLQSTMDTDVSIDVDTFADHHPAYEELALADDRTAQLNLAQDLSRWYTLCLEHAREQRLDVVTSGWHYDAFTSLRGDGWNTDVIFIAGDEAICDLRRLSRYMDEVESVGYGRWVPGEEYREFYHRFNPMVAQYVFHNAAADQITVLDRQITAVHRNQQTADGRWEIDESPQEIIGQLRSEPWGSEEFTEAYQKIDDLYERVPEDLLPGLLHAVRTAQTAQERTARELDREARSRLNALKLGHSTASSALGPHASPEEAAAAVEADHASVALLREQAEGFRAEGRKLGSLSADISTYLVVDPTASAENTAYRPPSDLELDSPLQRDWVQSV